MANQFQLNTAQQRLPPPDPPPPPNLVHFHNSTTFPIPQPATVLQHHATNQLLGSPNDMPFPLQHYEVGPMQIDSNVSSIPEENESTTSIHSQECCAVQDEKLASKAKKHKSQPNKASSMPESAAPSNPETLNDKSKSSHKRTHSTMSSKTLDQDSTSTDPDSKGFWKESTKELSKRLPSCTETDCAALDSSLWPLSLKKLALNSWFTAKVTQLRPPKEIMTKLSAKEKKEMKTKTTKTDCIQTNSPKISYPLSQCLLQAIMEDEVQQIDADAFNSSSSSSSNNNNQADLKKPKLNPNENQPSTPVPAKDKESVEKVSIRNAKPVPAGMILRSRKIKVYPTTNQKRSFNKWFGAHRVVYNACVDIYSQLKKKKLKKKTSIQLLRDIIFKGEERYGITFEQPDWFKVKYITLYICLEPIFNIYV
jgi:hypothetical protein